METPFTASNHITITKDVHGKYEIYDNFGTNRLKDYSHLNDEDMKALREFLEAERDEELNRWRDPKDKDKYVYTSQSGKVFVADERTRNTVRIDNQTGFGSYPNNPYMQVGLRYYAAISVKPWHSAKEGEVWELTCPNLGNTTGAFLFQGGMFRHGSIPALLASDENIVDARKIYPGKV